MPTKKPKKKYGYINAYRVVRKAEEAGPDAKVTNHGTVLGSFRYKLGDSSEKKEAMGYLMSKYEGEIRCNGQIYKSPHAVALFIYEEDYPAAHWVGSDEM